MVASLPQAAALFAALLAVSFGAAAWKAEAAAPPPVVVGSIKCLDCFPNDINAEDAFKGLQVAIKCKSAADENYDYETKAVGPLDDVGVFRIPLAAELLRDDGNLDRDCYAQLHSAPDTPCVGQAPPRIAPTQDGTAAATSAIYLAAAADTVFSPVACACGKKKKKHFMFGPPPPPPRPTPTPTPNPPTPTYGPPTPTPTPVPEPRPPAPEEPEPFFKKKPKMKFMHKKKPCPPLVDDDTTRPAAAGQEKLPKKLN
ncbi:hypothetical protein SETIT_9G471000v2 [Setaria italica]|uniref:Proline-rich protein n=1 Tax=Setaria italica TaxID=4555 RepID=K4AE31_SETIT|nr:proline-rich protein 4 [Setaria italica]RCV45645.1 hypothetical protein SETIT_9G471000v2 [Setaria italica]